MRKPYEIHGVEFEIPTEWLEELTEVLREGETQLTEAQTDLLVRVAMEGCRIYANDAGRAEEFFKGGFMCMLEISSLQIMYEDWRTEIAEGGWCADLLLARCMGALMTMTALKNLKLL